MIVLRRAAELDRFVWACAAMALGALGCPAKIQVGTVLETVGGLADGGDAGPDAGADAGDAGPDAGDAGPDAGFCFIGDLVVPSGEVSAAGCCNPALSNSNWSSLFVAGGAYPLGHSPSDTVAADFNNDGFPDIAVCDTSDSGVWVFFGTGDGGFTDASTFPINGQGWCDVSAGDLNGDGFPDLVFAFGGLAIGVMLNDGGTSFGTEKDYPTTDWAERVAIGDLDGDGRLDVVFGESHGNIGVLLNQGGGQGSLGAERTFVTGSSTTGETHVGDFNGDTLMDLAVTDGVSSVIVLLNDGGAGFPSSLKNASFDTPYPMQVGRLFSASSDDLAVGSEHIAQTDMLSASDAGLVVQSSAVTIAFGTVMIADFNGDGLNDIVVGTSTDYVILFNEGDGGFSEPVRTVYPYVHTIQDIAVADFNGDGAPDLAIVEARGNLTIWYYACPARPP